MTACRPSSSRRTSRIASSTNATSVSGSMSRSASTSARERIGSWMIGPTSGWISRATPIGSSGSMMSANRTAASTPKASTGISVTCGAQLGRLGQGQDRIPLAQLAVVGQAAAGLAHEPDRRAVGLLVAERGAGIGPRRSRWSRECGLDHRSSAGAAWKALRAARMVASSCSSRCAAETNQASCWLGGSMTPASSMAWKNVGKSSRKRRQQAARRG